MTSPDPVTAARPEQGAGTTGAAAGVVRYVGVDRRNKGRTGAWSSDRASLTERVVMAYCSGWKRLVVTEGDRVVAGIRHNDDIQRIWWVEP